MESNHYLKISYIDEKRTHIMPTLCSLILQVYSCIQSFARPSSYTPNCVSPIITTIETLKINYQLCVVTPNMIATLKPTFN